MTLPIRYIAGLLALVLALPALSQTGPQSAADRALAALTMKLDGSVREFRAVAPFRRDEFLAASFSLDGQTTQAALHVVTAEGEIGPAIPLPVPENYAGSRIDRLIPAGNAVIGIGHVAGGEDDRRGWVIRIEPDLRVSAETVLPVVHPNLPINYYYGGVLDRSGRLIVAGRADQPDFPGVGMQFNVLQSGLLEIAMVYPGGSASEAGLRPGDVITRIDNRELSGLSPDQMQARMAGPIDQPLQITIDRPGTGLRDVTLQRKMVTGRTLGVVAVLDATTMGVYSRPKFVLHQTTRAGLQDIGITRDGGIVGVGWWEMLQPDGSRKDKAWIVGFDSNLNPVSDQQFGLDGDSSIAQRLHLRRDGRLLVIGGLNARPEPVAFASELSMDGGTAAPARLIPVREHAVGPGLSDVFRGITTLSDGTTLVGGAFRSNRSPRFQAAGMALEGTTLPTPFFAGCAQSYVWDMASTPADSVAVAGYCITAEGERMAALMWSPPRETGTAAVSLTGAPRIPLMPVQGGQAFELGQADSVMVFVPAGTSGVLSLSDAAGQLVDFAAVDAGKAGLLTADLGPGRYVVGWASETAEAAPPIDVLKAELNVPQPDADGGGLLAPEMEKALSLLGYTAARQEPDMAPQTQSMALTRQIAAYQLSHDLPALGRVDVTTEIALTVEGAHRAEEQALELADLAARLSRMEDADTIQSRLGPVTGRWRGDAFVGVAARNSLSYAGEWRRAQSGELVPSGLGTIDNRTARETYTGMFEGGNFSGLGVQHISRTPERRLLGSFDDQARFTKGAVFEDGRLVASGFFAPGGRTLLQEVALPR